MRKFILKKPDLLYNRSYGIFKKPSNSPSMFRLVPEGTVNQDIQDTSENFVCITAKMAETGQWFMLHFSLMYVTLR